MIRAESKSIEEYEANIRVAEGLYNHVTEKAVTARRHEFFPLTIGGTKLVYWHSLVLVHEGSPIVPFFDPRRASTQLTPLAKRFVFSAMHERIRVAEPDFAHVKLGIFQFTTPQEGPRKPKLYTDKGIELFSYAELDAMVRETCEIWTEIFYQRTERERKRSGEL
jgi:hypothetical protein